MQPSSVFDIPKPQSYAERQAELHVEQDGLTRREIAQKLAADHESVFDPETAQKPLHEWVDRGGVMTCKYHPRERVYKRMR